MTQYVSTTVCGVMIGGAGAAKHPAERLEPEAGRPIHGRYDAAQSDGMNAQHWGAADSYDADSANSKSVRQRLSQRARYETGNNGNGKGIVLTQANYVVGRGPKLRMQTADPALNEAVETAWRKWAKAVKLARKLRTQVKAKVTDGEGILIAKSNPALKHPVKLDLVGVEAEQLTTPYLPSAAANRVDGITFDEYGNAVSYDLLRYHPGGAWAGLLDQPEQVPAKYVFHLFREDRPGQHRAVSELSPTLNLFAVGRRWREATVVGAENIANISLIAKTQGPPSDGPDEVRPFSSVPIEKGTMAFAPYGWDLYQPKPEQPPATYEMFARSQTCESARPLSMPYNIAAADSSDYSFSGGKLDHLTYFVAVDVEQQDIEDADLDPLFDLWFEEARLVYQWAWSDQEAPPHEWAWPVKPAIDEGKTASARKTNLSSGVQSLRRIYAEESLDFEEELAAMAQDYGVTVDRMRQILLQANIPTAAAAPAGPAAASGATSPTMPAPTTAAVIPGGTAAKPAPAVTPVTTQRSALLEMAGGIDGMLGILRAYSAGEISRASAIRGIQMFFMLSETEAAALVGPERTVLPTAQTTEPTRNGQAAAATN